MNMKKLCILAILGMSILAHGKELTTYSDVVRALTNGNPIRMVVVQFGESSAPTFYTEAKAVMIAPTYLQFANTHLTTNHPGFEKTPVLENVTYRISNKAEEITGVGEGITGEEEVLIVTRVISLPEYQMLKEHTLVCNLGSSAKIFTGSD
jgi:hypothetical protein